MEFNPQNLYIRRIPDHTKREGFIDKSYHFVREVTQIGRGRNGDEHGKTKIHIPEQNVSRIHAAFSFIDGKFYIHNNSNKGTWVNGHKIDNGKNIELRENDLIGLGVDTTQENINNNKHWIFKVCKNILECVDLISDDETDPLPTEVSLYDDKDKEPIHFQHDSEEEDNMFQKVSDESDSEQFYVDVQDDNQPSTSAVAANFYTPISNEERKVSKTNQLIDAITANNKFRTAQKIRHLGKKAPELIEAHYLQKRRGRTRKENPANLKKAINENLNNNYVQKLPTSKMDKLKTISNNQQSPEKPVEKPLRINAPVKVKNTMQNRNEQFAKDHASTSTIARK